MVNKKLKAKPSPKFTETELQRIESNCEKNYGHYPNVIGVGIGYKFIKDKAIESEICIQFYVKKKSKKTSKKLPRYIYNRLQDGSIDFSKKISTDVILLDEMGFACKAGSLIRPFGRKGALTLVFRNKATSSNSDYYAITCAHVAGDFNKSPPFNSSIISTCCTADGGFAKTVVNSTHKRKLVEYDIALAKITSVCSQQPELEVVGSTKKLTSFLSSNKFHRGDNLKCAFPVSRIRQAKIVGKSSPMRIKFGSRSYNVKNLFMIDRPPQSGDSGGLLYSGSKAVGILVAKSNKYGFFQSLGDAFKYLQSISSTKIKCF